MPAGEKERIALRREDAIRLRVEGNTYAEIAKQLGVSEGTAYSDVKAVLAESAKVAAENAHEIIELELRRLDAAARLSLREIQAGNLAAVERLVKTQERRAKLLGLDSPDRLEVGAEVELSPEAIANATREVFRQKLEPADIGAENGTDSDG